MSANIFVDMATTTTMQEGNFVSLSEIFRQDINRTSDADLHTKPAVVLVEEDSLKIFSSKVMFEFEAGNGDISYTTYKRDFDETDIFDLHFGGKYRYVTQNYRSNAAPVVFGLVTMFMSYFGDGEDGINNFLNAASNGRFEYSENTKGVRRFWFRRENGEWGLSSLCLFTDYLFHVFSRKMKYEQTDEYLIDWLIAHDKEHIGYNFVGYLNYLDKVRR